jgi:2-dehydropantoate 2-reductase
VTENITPFDFVVVTTKNIPDISPTVGDLIEPAVTPGKTVIVLSQNGLNIEKPIISRFPSNVVLSSVSLIGATEKAHGVILHDDRDSQKIGVFHSPTVPSRVAEAAARKYVDIYNGCGKLDITYDDKVQWTRWRKLVYNASFNSVGAVLRMDTARMRMSRHVIDDLIRPIMLEIVAAAGAVGHELPADLPELLIRVDPTDTAFKPSMCQDIEKGNFIELEYIVGEPLREGAAKGVAMPRLETIYGLLKGLQLQVKEARGMWEPRFTEDNPYS